MLISAYAFGGTPEKAVKKAFSEADIYFLTPDLLKEYRDVPLALEAEGKINPKNAFGFYFSGANVRFEPKTRKRWLDKTEHTVLSM